MSEMDDEIAALEAKLMELRRKKIEAAEAERLKLELERPVTIKLEHLTSQSFYLSGYRQDIIAYYQTVAGRIYNPGSKTNSFPIKKWDEVVEKLKTMSNVTLDLPASRLEQITQMLHAPVWKIEETLKFFRLIPNPMIHWEDKSPIISLAGVLQDGAYDRYNMSLMEGWRLLEEFNKDRWKDKKIEWDEKSKETALEQLEKREKLNSIALKKSSDFTVPLKSDVIPHEFQKISAEFIIANNGRGIVGNQMGLGKSLTALMIAEHEGYKKNLIICPGKLKENWRREIKKHLGLNGDDVFVCKGQIPDLLTIQKLVFDTPKWTIINYEVINYNTHSEQMEKDEKGREVLVKKHLWPWIDILKVVKFDNLIPDEAHKFKNMDADRTKAMLMLDSIPHVTELTGTPVINRPGELYPLLHLVDGERFPSHDLFLRQYTWKGQPINTNELRELLQTVMIRFLKKDVMPELPPIIPVYDWHELSDAGKQGYNKVLQGIYEEMEHWGDQTPSEESQVVANMLSQILRLKQICAYDQCEETADLAVDLFDSSEGNEFRKVIIFSQFKDSVRKIAARLGHEAVYFTGDNPVAERYRLCDQFQDNDDVHFLVCTMETAGEGLTLTKGGTVLFNDLGWTPAIHEQCIGRCYGRLNEAHGADVHFHVTKDSVMEWIQELLEAKLAIIGQVVEGHNEDRGKSVAMEIIKRLRAEMWKSKKG